MAEFEKIKQLVNLRGKLKHNGWYKVYPVSVKTDIAIHHSLTKWGDSAAFANYHVGTNKWPEVAYHFVILKDGTIEWNHQLGALSYHVGNSNKQAVGICLVGDFRTENPTDAQKRSLKELHDALVKDLPNYKRTRGHNEFPGYAWKKCPVFDYKAVINSRQKAKDYLSVGDSGKAVEMLQSKLRSIGYTLQTDGSYGPKTEQAVKNFQKNHNLEVDGYYGPSTMETLNKAIEKYKAVSRVDKEEDINMKETGFKDVSKDMPLAKEIKEAKELGLVHGYGDDTFKPDQPATRAEVAAMVLRAYKAK